LERVARSFLCIEFFPYASRRHKRARSLLPSQHFGFELARARIAAGATVVAFRQRRRWAQQLHGLDTSHWIDVRNPQAASLNPPSDRRSGNLSREDAQRVEAAIEAAA
jgi:hypothetical protein